MTLPATIVTVNVISPCTTSLVVFVNSVIDDRLLFMTHKAAALSVVLVIHSSLHSTS